MKYLQNFEFQDYFFFNSKFSLKNATSFKYSFELHLFTL